MLGTTVSSILARLEQCPEQRDDATSKLLSGLCEKLGRRNLTATVPESTSRVSEEELESILHHVRDATRIDHFLAACLLPGYREMIEDVRDKISIMDQLKSKVRRLMQASPSRKDKSPLVLLGWCFSCLRMLVVLELLLDLWTPSMVCCSVVIPVCLVGQV